MRLRFNELVYMVFTSKGEDVSWQKHDTENASEIEVVQSGEEVRRRSIQCVLKIFVVESEEEEFGILVAQSDGASRKKERTPATVRTVSRDAGSMWTF